jgi:hypothetical protein
MPTFRRPTRIVSIPPTILGDVGFNPHRKMHKRPSDYLMVVGALAATLAIVLWAFFG